MQYDNSVTKTRHTNSAFTPRKESPEKTAAAIGIAEVVDEFLARRDKGRNENFFMLFKDDLLYSKMLRENRWAAIIFDFFCRHANRSNALVASCKAIYEHLDINRSVATKAFAYLRDNNLVRSVKTGRDAMVWILNPDVVWKSWAAKKGSCHFANAEILLTEQSANNFFRNIPVVFDKSEVANAMTRKATRRLKRAHALERK